MQKMELSNTQINIWDSQKFYQDTPIGNVGGTLIVKDEKFDAQTWIKALNMYLQINDATRLIVSSDEKGKPLQSFQQHETQAFEIIDLSIKTQAEKEKLYYEWMQQSFGFNERLIDFKILKLGKEESGFFVRASHMVCDAFTMGLMGEQLTRIYTNLLKNSNYIEEDKPSYSLFLNREEEYKKSEKYSKDKEFWLSEFSIEPTNISLSAKQKTSISAQRLNQKIDIVTTNKIKNFCKENNITPAVFFEALVFSYMRRVTGENRLVIGSPVLNRVNRTEREITGMFISTAPLVLDVNENQPFETLCSQLKTKKLQLFRHQQYPFIDLQSAIQKEHGYNGPLFDVAVSYQNASITSSDTESPKSETNWVFSGAAGNGLIVNIDDRDATGEFNLNFDYQVDLFTHSEVENIINRLMLIASQAIENKKIELKDLEILTEKDQKIYYALNGKQGIPIEGDVAHVFELQASLHPDKLALVQGNKTWTYKELNELANSLAHTIKSYNLDQEEVIPIIGERSSDVIIAMLAIAKAGGASFIIDYDEYPQDRIDYLLNECQTKLLIRHNGCDYSKKDVQTIDLTNNKSWSSNCDNLPNHNSINDAFCVFHTSGSTGNPKCVVTTHAGVINMSRNNDYLVNGCENGINLSAMSFDAFLYMNLMSLMNARTLVLTTVDEQKSPSATEKLVAKHSNSFTLLTPSQVYTHLKGCQSDVWQNISIFAIGGEAWGKELKELISGKSNAILYNLYGPTESSVFNCVKKVTDDNVILGKPSVNFKHYIVDENNKILPPGAVGELVTIGIGLAKKYAGQPKLTQEKFITLPETGERAYKSGDLTYIDSNYELVFLGRKDAQIKINGLRIELEEIESNILSFEGISMAASTQKNHNGIPFLVGYYVSETEIDEIKLRKHLEKKLPLYMVPNVFMRIPKIPLTQSQKTNRKILPDPDFEKLIELTYEAPTNDVQRILCDIWQEILEMDKVGISNTFSSLGGTSRHQMEMQDNVEKTFGIKIKPKDLHHNPTIKMLADVIRENSKEITIPEYADLTDIIVKKEQNPSGGVLVAGVTGFLGNHIMTELLETTNKNIYCLVRDIEKFETISNFYFGKNIEQCKNRITLVIGDVAKPKLGLDEKTYNTLKTDISEVVNSAANVKHYGTVDASVGVNVDGTHNLLMLCAESGAKMHHISTLTVSGLGLTKQISEGEFTETDLDIGQAYKENIYVWTKYLAEKRVKQFQELGVEASIYRIGSIAERKVDGVFQQNEQDSGFRIITEAVKAIGSIPDELENMELQVVPVDEASKMVVSLMKDGPTNATYHIYNPKIKTLKEYLQRRGISYKKIDIVTFMNRLAKLQESDVKYYLVGKYLKDFMLNAANISVSNDLTIRALRSIGIEFDPAGQMLVRK